MKYVTTLVILATVLGAAGCRETKIAEVPPPPVIKQVAPEIAKNEIESKKAQFIDVRSPEEFGGEHARNSVNIPLGKVESELNSLDRGKPVYIICETGRRSQLAAETLETNGFTDVYNIEGGTTAWKKAGLPMETK